MKLRLVEILLAIAVGASLLPQNLMAQGRQNLEPPPSSAEQPGTARDLKSPGGKKVGNWMDISIQSAGAFLIILCNARGGCPGFSASLTTVNNAENRGSAADSSTTTSENSRSSGPTVGPVFQFYSGGDWGKNAVKPQRTGTNLPQRNAKWLTPVDLTVSRNAGVTTLFAPGEYVNGNLKNGVIFGTRSAKAKSLVSELLEVNTYLKREGFAMSEFISGESCSKTKLSGFSPKTNADEKVAVVTCSLNAGELFYAISVSSGQKEESYSRLNSEIVKSVVFR